MCGWYVGGNGYCYDDRFDGEVVLYMLSYQRCEIELSSLTWFAMTTDVPHIRPATCMTRNMNRKNGGVVIGKLCGV